MKDAEHANSISTYSFDTQRLPDTLPIADSVSNEHECSYLESEQANLPLKLPARRLTIDEFDFVLEKGVRRSGMFLYHTACGSCNACEPSRVDVHAFKWRDTFRRIKNRGDRSFRIQASRPVLDDSHLRLFNLHRTIRGLGDLDRDYRACDYEGFLVQSCCSETVELSYWLENELVAVSIIDCGRTSLSAVYSYFDPQHSRYSLGTYSILKQIEFARSSGRKYVYLGMFVANNSHLNYKSRFTPQERYIDGHWKRFEEHNSEN